MPTIKELDYEQVELCIDLDSNSLNLWSKKQWESEFLKKGTTIFALSLENKTIGVCSLEIILDEAQINYFLINKNYRREGHGRYLMLHLLSHCEKRNLKKIFLEVSELNFEASKFYESFHFLTIGRRKKYYKDCSDAVLKEKKLLK